MFLGYVPTFLDDQIVSTFDWSQHDKSDLLDVTRDVTPVQCHSHNDYWRRVPLYDALRWGCTGVEADVWLFDEELYVGHNTNALTRDGTFQHIGNGASFQVHQSVTQVASRGRSWAWHPHFCDFRFAT